MSDRPTLSAVMIARNEEKNLTRSLPTVKFADEIVVLENQSTDRTAEVAKELGAKVFSHPWEGYAATRNISISHATGDWVLILDADEVVSESLSAEILQAITDSSVDGYYLPTRNFIGRRAINHGGWYPDYHLRLVRRSMARYEEKAIHESIDGVTRVSYLKNPLIHHTYDSIGQWLEKTNRYTDLEAAKKPFSLGRLLFKPPFLFVRSYIFWSGWRDGYLGLIASSIGAWYGFLTEAKRWEQRSKD